MRQVLAYPVDSGGWVAIAPGLAGCIGQGSSEEEARANLSDATALYDEVFRSKGLAPPRDHVQTHLDTLPRISGHECRKALERAGYRYTGRRGASMALVRDYPFAIALVPDCAELEPWSLYEILRATSLAGHARMRGGGTGEVWQGRPKPKGLLAKLWRR